MCKHDKTIYPLPAEIIREIAVVTGIKSLSKEANTKKLDEACQNIYLDRNEIDKLVARYLIQPTRKKISNSTAERLHKGLFDLLNIYLRYTANVQPLRTRSATIHWLYQEFLALFVIDLINDLLPIKSLRAKDLILGKSVKTSTTALVTDLSNESSCSMAIDYLQENNLWIDEEELYAHDNRRMVDKWKNGDALPSVCSLAKFLRKQPLALELIFIARAIDEIRRRHYDLFAHLVELVMTGKPRSIDSTNDSMLAEKAIQIAETHSALSSKNKNSELKQSIKAQIESYISEIYGNKYPQIMAQIKRLSAMYHLFNGDEKSSLQEMKECVRLWLFNNKIDNEILLAALNIGSIQKNPDRVFLKNIYKIQVTFGFAQAINQDKDKANEHASHIQDWQIEDWRKLPDPDLLFSGVKQYDIKTTMPTAPLVRSTKKIKYRNPNQKIKVGVSGVKVVTYTPLIISVQEQDYVEVQKILSEGADVNMFSSSKDTAINCALLRLSPAAMGIKSIDTARKIVDLLLSEPYRSKHEKETLNTRTEKLKYMPLHSAIDACEPDYVRVLLSMGADPNIKATTDELSPLYHCIKCAAICKMHDAELKAKAIKMVGNPTTLAEKDAVHRYGNDLSSIPISGSLQQKVLGVVVKRTMQQKRERYTTDKFYQIAEMLLEHGADPNQGHDIGGIKSYTPLMFATEKNEVELLELMLKNGGDVSRTCLQGYPLSKRVSLLQIARGWESNAALRLLQDTTNA